MRKLIVWMALLGALGLRLAAGARESDPIRTGYERLYQGDLAGAYGHFLALHEMNPGDLAAAYGLLSSLYVRDLGEQSLDAEFDDRARQLLDRADARISQNQQDREALFYLAQTHGLRAGYRFHRKNLWGAVRDAAKSKRYSEAYVELNPGHADAYLALGLYNYYVDIAPSFLKVLRPLLFIPGGDREEGLQQLAHAARHGERWAPQAQLELIQIYGWLEGRVAEARVLAQGLARRYPDNPEVSLRLARLYAGPILEDYEQAAAHYNQVLERAEQGHPHYGAAVRYPALLELAGVQAAEWRLPEAIALLGPLVEGRPAGPPWVQPRSLLARARYRALLNDPNAADDARRVAAEPNWKEKWQEPARQLADWIEERRRTGEAARFAELIPGNRLVAESRWDLADKFYRQVRERQPENAQVRYRLGQLHFARGALAEAAAEFRAIVDLPGQPAWLAAGARLYLARICDLRGERKQAVKLYQEVADDYEEESAALAPPAAGLAARLGLVTPYQPPLRAAR